MNKECLIELMKRKYLIFGYESEEVLRIIYRCSKNQESNIMKTLKSLLNFIYMHNWMRNEYREQKLFFSEYEEKGFNDDYNTINKFINSQINKVKKEAAKNLEDKYYVESLQEQLKVLKDIQEFYNNVYQIISNVAKMEQEQDRVINNKYEINKIIQLQQIESQAVS